MHTAHSCSAKPLGYDINKWRFNLEPFTSGDVIVWQNTITGLKFHVNTQNFSRVVNDRAIWNSMDRTWCISFCCSPKKKKTIFHVTNWTLSFIHGRFSLFSVFSPFSVWRLWKYYVTLNGFHLIFSFSNRISWILLIQSQWRFSLCFLCDFISHSIRIHTSYTLKLSHSSALSYESVPLNTNGWASHFFFLLLVLSKIHFLFNALIHIELVK